MKKHKTIPTLHPDQFRKRHIDLGNGKKIYKPDFNTFYLQKIEQSCQALKLPLPPYRSTVHECVLLTEGGMMRSAGLERFSVGSNSVFFLPAGQITTIESIDLKTKGYYCHFDTSVLIRKFTNLHLINEFDFLRGVTNPVIALPDHATTHLVYLFKRISEEQQGHSTEGLIQSYLLTILFEIKQYYQSADYTKTSSAQSLTDKFKKLVSSNFKTKKLVTDYAQILNITPNHLNKAIKLTTGKSPTNWIDESVVLEAKVLLYHSSMSINEISYEIGIEDPSYFGRLFKKHTTITPTEFRKNIKR